MSPDDMPQPKSRMSYNVHILGPQKVGKSYLTHALAAAFGYKRAQAQPKAPTSGKELVTAIVEDEIEFRLHDTSGDKRYSPIFLTDEDKKQDEYKDKNYTYRSMFEFDWPTAQMFLFGADATVDDIEAHLTEVAIWIDLVKANTTRQKILVVNTKGKTDPDISAFETFAKEHGLMCVSVSTAEDDARESEIKALRQVIMAAAKPKAQETADNFSAPKLAKKAKRPTQPLTAIPSNEPQRKVISIESQLKDLQKKVTDVVLDSHNIDTLKGQLEALNSDFGKMFNGMSPEERTKQKKRNTIKTGWQEMKTILLDKLYAALQEILKGPEITKQNVINFLDFVQINDLICGQKSQSKIKGMYDKTKHHNKSKAAQVIDQWKADIAMKKPLTEPTTIRPAGQRKGGRNLIAKARAQEKKFEQKFGKS